MTRTIHVSTKAELDAAMKDATGGETIVLAGGDYGAFSTGRRYAETVTLISADPEDPARFEALDVRGGRNIAFDTLLFDYTFEAGDNEWFQAFKMSGQDLTVRNSVFDGDVAQGTGGAGDGYPTGRGLLANVSGLTLENNEFANFWKGAKLRGDDLVVTGNDFHTMRSDGLNVDQSNGVLIEGNHFHDFRKAPGSKDHADMLQFWVNRPGEKSSDIAIRGNLFDVGEGNTTQTIFMRNLAYDSKGGTPEDSFYRNVVIEENVILNGHRHGISVGATDGLTIANNTILQKLGADHSDDPASVMTPRINFSTDAVNVSITGNVAPEMQAPHPDWTVERNLMVQNDDPAAANHYAAVFVDSTLAEGLPMLRPGGAAEALGAGATTLEPGRAAFLVHDSDEGATVRVLDATAVLRAAGLEDEIGATRFEWDLGGDLRAEGAVISHDFGAGTHAVALRMTRPDGSVSTVEVPLEVASPSMLALDAEGAEGPLAWAFRDLEGALEMDPRAEGPILSGGNVQRMYEADALRFDVTLAADEGGAGGDVMQLRRALRLYVTEEGDVRLDLNGKDGKRTIEVEGAAVNDGAAHAISVAYDRGTQTATLTVDGLPAASGEIPGGFEAEKKALIFGNPWSAPSFDGTLSQVGIEMTPVPQDPYLGDPALIQEARLASDEPLPVVVRLDGTLDRIEIEGDVEAAPEGGAAKSWTEVADAGAWGAAPAYDADLAALEAAQADDAALLG